MPASAISDQFAFWQHELLKAGPEAHAIIHDKIVVIDPMSDDCVVVTGSHNLGYRASYNNDENLLIVRGHEALAKAYAVHVMDIYDHYRFRYVIQQQGTQAFSGLDRDDTWQDKYFDAGDPASHDANVWFGAGDQGNVTPPDQSAAPSRQTRPVGAPDDGSPHRAEGRTSHSMPEPPKAADGHTRATGSGRTPRHRTAR